MLYRGGKTLEEVLPEIEQIAETDSAISFFVEFFKRSTSRELFVNKTFIFNRTLHTKVRLFLDKFDEQNKSNHCSLLQEKYLGDILGAGLIASSKHIILMLALLVLQAQECWLKA